jgi:hypothetical protein
MQGNSHGPVVELYLKPDRTCPVFAQDLLESLGALNADEVRRLNAFHGAIF